MTASANRIAAVKSALLVTGSTYFTYALTLLTGALIARSLGPTDYGRYAFAVWLSGWMVTLAVNGINTSAIRFVSELLGRSDTDGAARVHGWLARLQRASLLLVLVGFAVALLAGVLRFETYVAMTVATVALSAASRTFYTFNISVAKAHQAFHVEAYSTSAVMAANVVAVVALWALHAPLAAYVALFGIASVAMYGMSAFLCRRAGVHGSGGPPRPEIAADVRQHLAWTVVLIVAGSLGNKTLEIFALQSHFGSTAVAYFQIAAALTRGGSDLLTVGLSTILLPAMGRATGAGGGESVRRLLGDSIRYFAFLGVVLAGVGGFWSAALIRAFYGAAYDAAIPVMEAMAVVSGVTLVEAAVGSYLSTTGRQRTWATFTVATAVLSTFGALVLVPRFGLSGAAASYAIARGIPIVAMTIWTTSREPGSLDRSFLWRLAACSAVAAASAWSVTPLLGESVTRSVVQGIVYVSVLMVGTLLSRSWYQRDLELTLAVLSRVPVMRHGASERLGSLVGRLFR